MERHKPGDRFYHAGFGWCTIVEDLGHYTTIQIEDLPLEYYIMGWGRKELTEADMPKMVKSEHLVNDPREIKNDTKLRLVEVAFGTTRKQNTKQTDKQKKRK